ncbi:transposase [methane-oxidizing endosymbiont of Gigantopelta aegis]|uniref:transposase n=1 Tax=methane-oxidizing endosymbiont of Gigantopelta aegis TaxID=2794938 RepID=UPI001FD95998|nr:transposase [methane-oxidizing endosymbiont of Gigantopelta aegis]
MPRTHAYSPVGEWCYGVHDWHAKGRINAIGAMMGSALVTVSLFEGSINADTFYAWLTQDLLPKLPEQAVIVMDNAAFHKRTDILDAIKQTTCTLEFLPPYSPDIVQTLILLNVNRHKLKRFDGSIVVMSIHCLTNT